MSSQPSGASVGAAISAERKRLGIKRAPLAREVGCHPKHLQHIERGTRNPSAELLVRIARRLGVSAEHLTVGERAA